MTEAGAWQVLRAETLLDQPPWLSVIRQAVRLPGGAVLDGYYLTPGRDYSMVVALTEAGEVLLVEQYKHGAGRSLAQFPAGYLDAPDEDPLVCAQRELLEETGHSARTWTALGAYYMDPNRSANCAHLFLAQDLAQQAEGPLDRDEGLRLIRAPAAAMPGWLAAGRMPSLACAAAWSLAAARLDS